MSKRPEDPRELIASVLDYPSVYMGGASPQSLRRADAIIVALEKAGFKLSVSGPSP